MGDESIITVTRHTSHPIPEYSIKDWYILWGIGDEYNEERHYSMEGDRERYAQVRTLEYTLLLVATGP